MGLSWPTQKGESDRPMTDALPVDGVPVVDISAFLSGSDGASDVVAQVRDACTHVGFFQIVGHGIPDAQVDEVYSWAKAFFAQPEPIKATAAQPAPDQVRGWSGVGAEALSSSLDNESPGDLKEKMDMGPPHVDLGDDYFTNPVAGPHFAPNVWPTAPAELQPTFEAYFDAMSELSRQLMSIFAAALDLPGDYFDPSIDRHISMFRVLNYPSQPTPPLPGQLRAGAHSDYGSLTIVRQEDRPGGLEVLAKSGQWVPVPAIAGAFVVNIGDLMAEWTNDRWVSTLHRVVNPPRDLADDSQRISLVFFHQPNYDALIECLPTVLEPGETAKYEPVTSGDHLYSKFVKQTGAA